MNKLVLSVKVLVLAAYVLAMLGPGLFSGEQSQAVHAQMMAMPGHD